MRCAGCGQTIEGEPFWVDNEAYCSEQCAEEFALDEEGEEWEEEYEA